MTEIRNSKRYDLEERTLKFAKQVIEFVNKLPKTLANLETGRQLVKAAGSVGANYAGSVGANYNETVAKALFLSP